MVNSRMKDYFDLAVLLDRESLDTEVLARSIAATFLRRGMAIPEALPIGLTDGSHLIRRAKRCGRRSCARVMPNRAHWWM